MPSEQKTSGKNTASSPAAAGAPASPLGGWMPPGAATPEPEAEKLPTLTSDQQLRYLKEVGGATYLLRVLDIPVVRAGGVKKFIDEFMADAHKSSDPVEGLIVQQLLVVHFRLLRLHAEAVEAEGLEARKIYNSASARLASEFRRMTLTLRQYRQPVAATKTFSVVHQQNVSTVERGQEVSYIDRSVEGNKDALMMSRSRLSGMDATEGDDDEHDAKPAARGRRSDHRPVAAAVD